jgi:propanol-preferring alcohol dehydrogenase
VPERMKAIQVVEFNAPYQINEVDVPKDLQPTDLLVKIAVASNCHTDSMVQAGIFGTNLPCTASHEGAGTIVAVGDAAKERGFAIGQRVMCGLPLHPCGVCVDCLGPEAYKQYCTTLEGHIGVHQWMLRRVCKGRLTLHNAITG